MVLPESTNPVRIGLIGPPDIVERMIDIGHALATEELRAMSLLGTPYQKQSQIADRVRGIAGEVDAMLFAGPLPYDVARDAGALTTPATYVELAGSSLYGAMLRAIRQDELDIQRVSIDSLDVKAIREAYEECGLSSRRVRALKYDGLDSAARFVEFHREHHAAGRTTGALTTVGDVERALTKAGIPVVRIRATNSAVRASLRAAALLGTGGLLEAAHVVVGLIEIPELPKRLGHGARGPWAMQELRLAMVKALRPDTERLAISVMPRDERSFALVATFASISEVTRHFTVAPFIGRVQRATGVTPSIGFGLGSTAAAAEANAEHALVDARNSGGARVFVRLRDGSAVAMSHGARQVEPPPELLESKHLNALRILRHGLAAADADAQLVDAETAARLLGISARTARRVLQDLARDGLVWPVPPPASGVTPGRPRQTYRLVGTAPG
jgi:hypothetical protein